MFRVIYFVEFLRLFLVYDWKCCLVFARKIVHYCKLLVYRDYFCVDERNERKMVNLWCIEYDLVFIFMIYKYIYSI